jgi:uncharacterized protein (DUF362 family)
MLSRRAVLRGLGATATTLFLPRVGRAADADGALRRRDGYRPHVAASWVSAAEPGALDAAVRAVADAATDFVWLAPGDRVLVKVAANSGSRFPATSSPAALFALVRHLYARGAGEVLVGDQSGVHHVRHTPDRRKGSTRALMRRNGLWQAAETAAAVPVAFEELGYDAYVPERLPGRGHWRGDVWITRVAAEADHIVYLPRVSHHTLAFATLGQKIGVGWLREDSRLELHRDAGSFAEKFAEVSRLPAIAARLRLVVTDATSVLTTFGPDWGYVARPEAGLVLASTDLVAHDVVAHRWLDWTRAEATHAASPHWLVDAAYGQASFANRTFVETVWGSEAGARTERLRAPRVRRPLDDPALADACRARGGMPEALALEWVGRTAGAPGAREFLAGALA